MKMNCKFFGLGAKVALCFVAVLGTLTSCYEKEDIKTIIDTTPKTVTYTISGSVYDYTNLNGINNANVVMTKGDAANATEVAKTQTKDGNFSISLTGLTDADRGDYTLTVSAAGFKTRSTQITIYFEQADNQTIANHMDFALKSIDMQGEEVKVVAGREDETVEIKGADGETDVIEIPKNVFGAGAEPKAITIQREPKSEETASNAVRVYEGKPDGLKFVEPLEFTFDAPKGKNLKVYYEVGGVWKIADAENDPNVVDNGDGTYTAKIYHFSRFKFSENDYEYSIEAGTASVADGNVYGPKAVAYFNNTNKDESYPFELKNVRTGAMFVTSLDQVFANCAAKEIAINYFKEYLNGQYTEAIGDNFKTGQTVKTEINVPAHNNLSSVTATENIETVTYTMNFDGQKYPVTVKQIKQYMVTRTVEDFTHGQGIGHGHGHGDELNAGGGIIDFE